MKAAINVESSVLDNVGLTADQLQAAVINALGKLECPLNGNPIFLNDLQVEIEVSSPLTLHALDQEVGSEMTVDKMKSRIALLSNEIDANEEENKFMQIEIDSLYAQIDKAQVTSN